MQNKAEYNMTEKLVDSIYQMLTDYLPQGNQSTGSHYETEKLMLVSKDDEKEDKCLFCGAKSFKED